MTPTGKSSDDTAQDKLCDWVDVAGALTKCGDVLETLSEESKRRVIAALVILFSSKNPTKKHD